MLELKLPHVEPTYQRLRAWKHGQLMFDTRRAYLYFIDRHHPHWAVPAADVIWPVAAVEDAERVDDLVVLEPDAADLSLEEDQRCYGMPRSPYHRVDTLTSSRHVRVRVAGMTIADTTGPVLLVETGVTPRWYIPPSDIAWNHLEPILTRTTCQYKGEASYFRLVGTDVHFWCYEHADPEVAAVAGMLAAAGDAEITVDGRPEGGR